MKQLTTILFLLISLSLQAQEIQLSTITNLGLGYKMNEKSIYEPGFSGAGIRADLTQSIGKSRFSLINGLEFSFAGWGSNVLFNTGFTMDIFENGSFKALAKLNVLNGIALFKDNPLYVGVINLGPELRYHLKRNFSITLASGIRYLRTWPLSNLRS